MKNTFHVGQMVRVIKTENRHEFRGKIVQVVKISFTVYSDLIYVDILKNDTPWEFECGFPDQFAPIDDDGRKIISWEECVWKPQESINS